MKVLSIAQYNVQNFKGLWGERHPKAKNINYYPFSDETPEQIEQNTQKHKRIISIMAALPFTSKEVLKYTKNRLENTRRRIIDKYFINKGLSTVIK